MITSTSVRRFEHVHHIRAFHRSFQICYIALAVYSNSQATMDNASEPGVRGTFFRAIPQLLK